MKRRQQSKTKQKTQNNRKNVRPSTHPDKPVDVHNGSDGDGATGLASQRGGGRNHGSCRGVHSGALSPCGCSLAPAGREVELCRHAGSDDEDDQ